MPSYIIPSSPEDEHWHQTHPNGQKSKNKSFTTGSTVAHLAAQGGDVDTLKKELKKKKDLITAKDKNGWQPIHEGARGGHVEVVRYLVENGADINAKTNNHGTALYMAKQQLDADHPLIAFLESLG